MYEIIVFGKAAETYDLGLMIVGSGGCSSGTISCGQTLSGTLPSKAGYRSYTFAGNAGEAVALSGAGILFDPNGARLPTNVRGAPLPTSGNYTIVVKGPSYETTLQFTTGRCALGTLSCGDAGHSIDSITDVDAWKFSANAGDAVIFEVRWVAPGDLTKPKVELYGPDGNQVYFNNTMFPRFATVLGATGTYTILVGTGLSTGAYTMSFRFAKGGPAACFAAIGCGQTLSGILKSTTQLDGYQYFGNKDEVVYFYLNSHRASFYDPSGGDLNWTSGSPFTLPATGTYTLMVQSYNGSTGEYDLKLQYTTGRCAQPLTCAQALIKPAANQLDAYKISGSAGQRVGVYLAGLGGIGTGPSNGILFDPRGQLIGTGDLGGIDGTEFGGGAQTFTLPQNGDYTYLANTGSGGTYTIYRPCPGQCAAGPLYVGKISQSLNTNSGECLPQSGSGVGTVAVLVGPGCPWTSSSRDGWMKIVSGGSSNKLWHLTFQADSNPTGSRRTANLTIGGSTFEACQEGSTPTCYTLTTSSNPVAGGTVTVNTSKNCGDKYNYGTAISLTPTAATSYVFSHWSGTGGTFSNSSSANTTFTITDTATVTANFTSACPTISLSPGSLPNGTIGASYSQSIAAAGGASPYSYSVTSGSLPAGLTLSSAGVLSGTPTTAGTSTFTIRAKDSKDCTGSLDYSVTVGTAACPTISFSTDSLPNGTVGTSYSQIIAAAGGTSPYQYAISTGSLPPGLTLSSAGVLAGTPSTANTYNFTIQATDSKGCTGSKAYSITVGATACQAISLSPGSLPNGTVGASYSQTVAAAGGASPYSYSVTSGSLPAGLTLSEGNTPFSSAGVLSGTPTTAGTYTFTIRAKDSKDCTGSKDYSLTVGNAACPAISLSPASLPNGTVGLSYGQTVTASGGTAPYSYSVTSGSLPAGLTLSTSGILSGKPATAGASTVTIKATDANGCSGTGQYSLTIAIASIPAGQFKSVFPQIAVAGQYVTYLTFNEPDGATKQVKIEIFDDSGAPFPVSFDGSSPSATADLTLGGHEERILKLTLTGDTVRAGWARVTSYPGKVDASLRYSISSNGQLVDAVGIPAAENIHSWKITGETRGDSDYVGLAVVNPNSVPIEVHFNLYSNGVSRMIPVTKTIPALGHYAAFTDNIFGSRFNGIATLTVYADGYGMHVMALRLENGQFSSMPADKASLVLNWTTTGSGTVSGQMYVSFVDLGTFYGLETTAGTQTDLILRGWFYADRFMAERVYSEVGGEKGVVLYQGTYRTDSKTIQGTRVFIRDDGVVTLIQSFTATIVE